jgi:hypothetical protein
VIGTPTTRRGFFGQVAAALVASRGGAPLPWWKSPLTRGRAMTLADFDAVYKAQMLPAVEDNFFRLSPLLAQLSVANPRMLTRIEGITVDPDDAGFEDEV